jgi:hypothetical protein
MNPWTKKSERMNPPTLRTVTRERPGRHVATRPSVDTRLLHARVVQLAARAIKSRSAAGALEPRVAHVPAHGSVEARRRETRVSAPAVRAEVPAVARARVHVRAE